MWKGECEAHVNNIGIHQEVDAKWTSKKRMKDKCKVDKEFASVVTSHLVSLGWEDNYNFLGYTEMTLNISGRFEQFCFSDCYHGSPWYDWCLVCFWSNHLKKETHRAAKILGVVAFDSNVTVVRRSLHAVVHVSQEEVTWDSLQIKFIEKFTTSSATGYEVILISDIVAPLGRFKNYGGRDNEHFCALPERM